MSKCDKFKKMIPLDLYNELSVNERKELEDHLNSCQQCRLEFKAVQEFLNEMNKKIQIEPSEALLVESRNLLRRRLKDKFSFSTGRQWMERFAGFLQYRPIRIFQFSVGLAVLVVGFLIGRFLVPADQMIDSDKLFLSNYYGAGIQNLISTEISDPKIVNFHYVRYSPTEDQVEIRFNMLNQVALRGTLYDTPIRDLLTYAVRNTDHPGIRLQSVKALGSRYLEDEDIQNSLIHVLEHDENAGMRLRAIKILKKLPMNQRIKNSLMRILFKDTNSSIRVEAIDALSKWPEKDIQPAFINAAREDENEFVRLKASKIIERREKSAKTNVAPNNLKSVEIDSIIY